MVDKEDGANPARAMCDDCGQPIRSIGVMLYDVRGPNPGPSQYGSKYYSVDLTVREIGGHIETRRIYVDGRAQRGQKDANTLPVPEYCLADDTPKGYVVEKDRVTEMVQAMESGTLFGGTLTWNLRPGESHWHYDENSKTLVISSDSRVYLPDSHHRHLSIKVALSAIRENRLQPAVGTKAFTINIYTMPVPGEMQLFYEYNVLGKAADATRAQFLAQTDPISKVIRELISRAPLAQNVETVTNLLSKSSARMVTFRTLHDAIRDARKGGLGKADDEVAFYSQYFGMLAKVRPELGLLSVYERNRIRGSSVVDQAVMFYAYVAVAEYLREELESATTPEAMEQVWTRWSGILGRLRGATDAGVDFFDRKNPVWKEKGVLRMSRAGTLVVTNNRDTRAAAYDVVVARLGLPNVRSGSVTSSASGVTVSSGDSATTV